MAEIIASRSNDVTFNGSYVNRSLIPTGNTESYIVYHLRFIGGKICINVTYTIAYTASNMAGSRPVTSFT